MDSFVSVLPRAVVFWEAVEFTIIIIFSTMALVSMQLIKE